MFSIFYNNTRNIKWKGFSNLCFRQFSPHESVDTAYGTLAINSTTGIGLLFSSHFDTEYNHNHSKFLLDKLSVFVILLYTKTEREVLNITKLQIVLCEDIKEERKALAALLLNNNIPSNVSLFPKLKKLIPTLHSCSKKYLHIKHKHNNHYLM